MNIHLVSSRFTQRISRRFLPLVAVGILGWGIASPAGAASIWNPTLLVNTESFNTIDDGDGTTNIQLRFGDTLRETITYNRSSSRFDFSRAIFVGGNITGTGSLSIKKVMSGAALRVDNNADIWGSLAVSGATLLDGNLSTSGALAVEGAAAFGSTVKLNGVTYTFPGGDGSASGKVLKTNAAGQLSWSADIDTNTNAQTLCAADQYLDGDGNCVDVIEEAEMDSMSELETQAGSVNIITSGEIDTEAELETLLTDVTNVYTNNDGVLFDPSIVDNRYVNTSGDTMTGALTIGNGAGLSVSGSILTETNLTINSDNGAADAVLTFGNDSVAETIKFNDTTNRFEMSDDLGVLGDLEVTGSMSGRTLQVTGTGAAPLIYTDASNGRLGVGTTAPETKLDVVGTISGSTIAASTSLTSSGTFAVEGAAAFGSTVKLNGVTYTFPGGDGSASGKVLKTNAAGQLSWSADTDTNTTYAAGQGLTLAGTVFTLSAAHSGSTIKASAALASSGTIAATGTIGTRGDITLNGDNGAANAVLTFGNDSGAETLQFNDSTNEFDLSDDLNVTGTLDVTDTITTNTNLTINADNGAADAILTFGNDGVAETIKFNDTTNRFEMSDDLGVMGDLEVTGSMSGRTLQVTGTGAAPLIYTDASNGRLGVGTTAPETKLDVVGTISGSTVNASTSLTSSGTLAVEGNAAIGGTIKLNGTAYTFPGTAGSNGQTLTTSGNGTLTWSASTIGVGSGGVLFLSPEYPHAVYVGSGSSYVGQLSAAYDATNKENYYHWTSSKATPLQEYTIAVRIRVPDNFSAWDANLPVQLRYRTGTALNTDNLVSLRMQDTAGAWVTLTGNENLAATSWTTATITGPQAAGTYTKAGYITLFIKLSTTSAGSADAGYINLNWETSAP